MSRLLYLLTWSLTDSADPKSEFLPENEPQKVRFLAAYKNKKFEMQSERESKRGASSFVMRVWVALGALSEWLLITLTTESKIQRQ